MTDQPEPGRKPREVSTGEAAYQQGFEAGCVSNLRAVLADGATLDELRNERDILKAQRDVLDESKKLLLDEVRSYQAEIAKLRTALAIIGAEAHDALHKGEEEASDE